ncbi:beta-galactosidase [Salipaludibacillus neizhouensis]|uniref:Beta-galactosidase n=1 Tax=Salipaludibacillus neizhouensis TaxID=885475 RepID=A0A3A9K6W4_9BACI|nr:beta-galactosidase [Salipaludibacillus neizhouensis]RKL68307.1 beta-galactosidase [Salipaludibacillus neizhouensis]
MLTTKGEQFMLHGEPFRILSGSIHYFRVVPEYWEDRLDKLKQCGFNTVETYIPWNFHEPKKGDFRFEGMADVERFIQLAAEKGLYVIVRPSPYICAEWEFGGLPAWLLKDKNMEVRCVNEDYMRHLKDYFDVLLPKLAPLQISNGGPVIAMQIENEYGAYGNDKEYLEENKQLYLEKGIDVLLFTSDGPDMIKDGSLPDVLTTLNFGSKVKEAYGMLDEFKPGSPKFCAEFWIGWFDSWGNDHHTRTADNTADVLQEMLDAGGSMNFFMFHGGTNFHFYNGANRYETYDPTITSYDYDSLLTESGEITDKYREVQKVLHGFKGQSVPADNSASPVLLEESSISMSKSVSLFDTLSTVGRYVKHKTPLSMEGLDQSYGYVLYRTIISGKGTYTIDLEPMRDRGFIYINGEYVKTYYRNDVEKEISFDFPQETNTLEIFVENMGRVNYGKHLKDRKGIVENLWINNQFMFDWEMYAIELEDFELDFSKKEDQRFPQFFEGVLHVSEPGDTFVKLEGWKKGNVFVNGFNLGRYWEIGPQKTLYLPGPLLKKGANTIQILELEGSVSKDISFVKQADLG